MCFDGEPKVWPSEKSWRHPLKKAHVDETNHAAGNKEENAKGSSEKTKETDLYYCSMISPGISSKITIEIGKKSCLLYQENHENNNPSDKSSFINSCSNINATDLVKSPPISSNLNVSEIVSPHVAKIINIQNPAPPSSQISSSSNVPSSTKIQIGENDMSKVNMLEKDSKESNK